MLSVSLAASTALSLTPTAEAAPVYLNQGEEIQTQRLSCSLGFIDNGARTAYTAKHCGGNGETVYANRGGKHIPIGRLVHVPGSADYAKIKLYGGIQGSNKFTGNRIYATPFPGETICMYGNTTKRVTCTRMLFSDPGRLEIRTGTGAVVQKGDSGGPAWVPGKGYVGVISTKFWFYGIHTSGVTHHAPDGNPRVGGLALS